MGKEGERGRIKNKNLRKCPDWAWEVDIQPREGKEKSSNGKKKKNRTVCAIHFRKHAYSRG